MARTEDAAGPAAAPSEDASLSELPLLKSERIWGFWDSSAVNVGLAIATWAFLQGGAVAYYVGAKQAVAATIIGYGVSVLFVALAPCVPSGKYGVEQYVILRSIFGVVGARILMIVLAVLFAAAWSAVLSIMFGHAIANISNQLFDTTISHNSIIVTFMALLSVVVSWLALAKGPVSVEWLNRIVVPGLCVVTVGMLILVFTEVSWTEMTALPPIQEGIDKHTAFMLAIELNIAGGFAWWPNVGNLSRLSRTSRTTFWPNFVGLFLASVVAAIVGAFAALALKSDDPTVWMVPLGGAVLGIIALAFIGLANITSIVAQGYSTLVALKGGGSAIRRIPWALLAALLLAPAAVIVFFPASVYDNYDRFVSWGAIIVAPLCAIQFVDYFVLRGRRLNVRALYETDQNSPYFYWKGFNIPAWFAAACGAVTYMLLLDPITYEPSAWFGYLTASLPSGVVAGGLHYVFCRFWIRRAGLGGYAEQETAQH